MDREFFTVEVKYPYSEQWDEYAYRQGIDEVMLHVRHRKAGFPRRAWRVKDSKGNLIWECFPSEKVS